MKRVMNTLVVLAIAGTAQAQTITATGGNAQFTYNTGAVPTTAPVGTVGGGSANLDTNGATAGGDSLFENWWYYRVEGVDTREIRYNAPANPFVAAGNTMTGTFNFANFRSELTYVISDADGAGTNTALLNMQNKITNTSASAQTINIYSYGDFDPNGSFSHPYSYDATPTNQWLTGTSGAVTFFYRGDNAGAYQAAPFTSTSGTPVRGALADGDVDNLNNTVTGSPGDFSGAFQWTFTLNPGDMMTLTTWMGLNSQPPPVVPTPGALALAGLAGFAGLRRRR